MSESELEREKRSSSSQPRLRVKDVLMASKMKAFTIPQNKSIKDCIHQLIKEETHSLLVLDGYQEVIGLFTAKDVLRFIHNYTSRKKTAGPSSSEEMLNTPVSDIMTPREKIVYCFPNDTSRRCREIMFQLKIRNMPVLENGEVIGMITMRKLADAAFTVATSGGKKAFIDNVMGRKGIPLRTKVKKGAAKAVITERLAPSTVKRQEEDEAKFELESSVTTPLMDLEVGSFALPHPFKLEGGVAGNRREFGANELATDISLSEDDFFSVRALAGTLGNEEENPDVPGAFTITATDASASGEVYLCVADGVGSWREYGVDPRLYSHSLVRNARKVIENDVTHRGLFSDNMFDRDMTPIQPFDVLLDAWTNTATEGVVGSCCICIATLDRKMGQLTYANVGDCGLVVFRRATKEFAGSLSVGTGNMSASNRIIYLSQQQLKGFNMPYQLGNSVDPNHPSVFESPVDADVSSINVNDGDIVLLATDGLFDNLTLDEITDLVSKWDDEQLALVEEHCDDDSEVCFAAREEGAYTAKSLSELASRIGTQAREYSLDKDRDSPFATLAKENDIMWGGGMPDDTTIVVARVVLNKDGEEYNTLGDAGSSGGWVATK